MITKKAISTILIISIIILNTNISFANIALEQANQATYDASKTFDGKSSLPNLKANINLPKTEAEIKSIKEVNQNPPKEEKPSFLTKVGWDIVNNKESYIMLGISSGLLGFILGGPIGALIGIGAMMGFTVSQRAWYIDAYAKPPKK